MYNTIEKCIIINLDIRPDRYETVIGKIPIPFYQIERFPAIYGHDLKITRSLEQLFNSNDYNYRRGIIGCALSHIKIWIEHIGTANPLLILEDDVDFVPDCKKKIDKVLQITPSDWDIIFLGFTPREETQKLLAHTIEDVVSEKWDITQIFQKSYGGALSYIINPNCIPSLLTFLQKDGMTNAIDTMMLRASTFLNIYHCSNQIIYHPKLDMYLDTNIQRDFLSMKRPFHCRFQDELMFYKQYSIPMMIIHDSIPDMSVFDTHVVFCSSGKCGHSHINDNMMYHLQHIVVHVPYTLIVKYPCIADIGLIVNGKWSTSNVILL